MNTTDSAADTKKTNPALGKVLGVAIVGVALYGVFVVVSGLDKIRDALATFQWWSLAAAMGLAFGNYMLRFLKWEFYLARLNIRGVPKLESLLIFLSGFVLTVTPGKVGEVFKSAVFEERHGVPLAKTAPIVIAERVTDVIGIVVLISVGSLGLSGGIVWAAAGATLVLALLVFIGSPKLSLGLIGKIEAVPKLAKLGPKLRTAYESLSVLVSPTNLGIPAVISVVAWLLECLALWVILQGFGAHVPVGPCLFYYATSTLAGALIPVPGGLGITEGMLQTQLVNLGQMSTGIATAAMLLVRFATLWFAVLVGFVAYVLLKLKGKPASHLS
jgi:glycosyltransferase 2 family protein